MRHIKFILTYHLDKDADPRAVLEHLKKVKPVLGYTPDPEAPDNVVIPKLELGITARHTDEDDE
jgi:hypothetical protein